MQTEHKIGQLLIIGLPGAQLDGVTRELLQTIQPGGVILDRANLESAEQVAALTAQIHALSPVPPLITIDQEGGRVDRLKEVLAPMPSADLLRAAGDAATASRLGEITADALRALGFNMNFAPVLDIPATGNDAPNGLQGRYLGGSSGQVINRASAYLEGLQRNGVIGVGKHFPGLGTTVVDSHAQLPQVTLSKEELKSRDLLPYVEMFSKINSRLVAVLIGHAHYAAYDGQPLPASLSRSVVNGLLRDELGFRGLAITDDLGMGAVSSVCGVGEAAVRAIEVGVDMALVCGAPEQAMEAWQAMVEAANRGRIMKTHISRAFDHIARVKSMVSPPHPYNETAIETLRENIAELHEALQSRV